MTPSSWPARFSLLALALAFHSISVVNADDHLKPRSIWSRRHRDMSAVRRQVLAGGSLPDGPLADAPSGSQPTTPLFLVGDPTSVDPATFPLSTSQSSAGSDPSPSTDSNSSVDPNSSVGSNSSVDSSSSAADSGPTADSTSSTEPTPTADSKSSTDSSSTTDPISSTEPSASAVSKSSTDLGSTTDLALNADSTLSTESSSSTDANSSTESSSSPSLNSNPSADVDNILSQILSFLTASESSTPEATSDPSTPTPTPTPTSIPTSTEPSTPNTDSAPSNPGAVDSTVVPSTSSEVTSAAPLLPDLPILSDATKSAQATSDDSQVPSAPTPSTDSAPSTPGAVDSTVVPSTSSEVTSTTPLLPDLPILSDATKSAQATSDDPQVPSAPTPTLDAPSTLVDTATSSSTTDGGNNLLSSIFAVISSIVDPPSSSTSETPQVIPDLPILTQSSTSETPFLSIDLPTSLPATNQPLVSLDLPISSSTSETPFLSIDLPTSSSIDLPISSSTTDFPTSPSTSRDGVVITEPPTSSTIDSFNPSGTTLPTISSNSGNDILSLNISSFLPGNPSSIDTDGVTTVSSSAPISVSIRSEFNYLTASSLDIVPIPTTSTSVTITNPDAPLTSVSSATEADGAVTGTVSAVPVPTNLPQFIKPSDQSDPVDPNSNPDGYMLITILFEHEVGWTAVLSKSEIAGAIMAWVPGLVTAILGITDDDLKLVGLKAYAGPDYQASQNIDDIQTMLLFYLKTDQVQTLKSYYTTSGSVFYTTGNTVTKQLTALVVKTYPIAATMDPHNGTQNSTDNTTSTTVDNGRRNAIIAVCVTFGTIALAVFIWWAVKTRQQRRNAAHRRLSYRSAPNYGATGAPRLMAERGDNNNNNLNNSGGGAARRNSFYAFGQENDSLEDETFDYISQHSQGGSGGHGPPVRRPVAGQPISQPILRETSMGQW